MQAAGRGTGRYLSLYDRVHARQLLLDNCQLLLLMLPNLFCFMGLLKDFQASQWYSCIGFVM
jgi:hypothetical protein